MAIAPAPYTIRRTPGKFYNFRKPGIVTFSVTELPHQTRGGRLVDIDDTHQSYIAYYFVNAQDEETVIFYTPK